MKMNLLLLFLAAMVVRATSQPPNPFPLPYDYYSVVFQWLKSVCNGRNPCIKSTFPAFTLHGLWPQRYHFPPLDDCRLYPQHQLTYFATAPRVATSIDLYSILSAAGILCGNPTTVGAVRTAIHASTGFWPTVQCNRSITGTLQLFQMYLCFNKITNVPMDCPVVQKGCINPIDYPRP
ncbi:ribonuclease 1 [Quercus suber]|uniref:Ribonuclease 1 n=1 Tax=Quercus suber TaxID=58331 RepID=A0AAW0LVL4_QUESU